jgi:two-component system, response regulator PdtaR
MRILIAEDETIIRLDLRGMLEAAGYEVREARDGTEAVEIARDWDPELVMLDVKMPELDGIEAARRINALRPVPVVLVTAYTDEALVKRAVAAGIFAYLVKPFKESEIVPVIETAWARHADWLDSRRELGRRIVPGTETVDVVVGGTHRYPLRIERHADGSVDVTLTDAPT